MHSAVSALATIAGRAMSELLSQEDVARLLVSRSPEARAETVTKVARQFSSGSLSRRERAIAEDIFRALVNDAETLVREALANHVKDAEDLPHDVALALARDTDSVAAPILKYSTSLSDADLVDIVRHFGSAKQVAIASRETVSSGVADALVEKGDEEAVVALVGNDGADITEDSLQKVLTDWGDNERFHSPLVERQQLPVSVAERLVALVSEQLQDHLVAHHELPPTVAADLALQSRERATIGLASGDDDDIQELVDHLAVNGRLSATLLLRSLCMGDGRFFEFGIARLAGIPVANARTLIHDSGPLGLQNLYTKADLPEALMAAFRIAVDVAHETELDGGERDQERYSRRMIERVLTQYEDIGADNLEYLLTRLGKLASPHSVATTE